MKTTIPLIAALMVILTSCTRNPYVDFLVSSHTISVYEDVYFTNTSSASADYFEWDFGDGTWSNAFNASHYYTEKGIYAVTLTAYNGLRISSSKTIYIEVLTTGLNIIVEEYYTHNRIYDASVILYPTLTDWEYWTNEVVEGYTDQYGVVRFENLDPVVYYVDIWHPEYNNYILASENIGWIMTDQLVKDAVNEYVFYVDYVGSGTRKDGKKSAQYKVIKVEPRVKKIVE